MAPIYAKGRRHVQLLLAVTPLLRIATRGSPLALAQARELRAALARAHGWQEDELDRLCPLVTVKTSGDRIQDKPLAEAGGKGLFVKEVEEALLAGEAEIATHSLKDLPDETPEGLVIAAVLPRLEPQDVFIAGDGSSFSALRQGARLGTSSPRRSAQALRARSDLVIVNLRGNVETRLAKLARGEADAIILAKAGLGRLNLSPAGAEKLDWLPALCQGAIGAEIRLGDTRVQDLVFPVNNMESAAAIACERGFLVGLEGSCRTPVAGLAEYRHGKISFRGEVLTLDGRNHWAVARDIMVQVDDLDSLARIGREAADEIREKAGPDFPRA
ncbi:MAG: hydroxymethylbilane synthase [Alphaproteobacteria bacterium]